MSSSNPGLACDVSGSLVKKEYGLALEFDRALRLGATGATQVAYVYLDEERQNSFQEGQRVTGEIILDIDKEREYARKVLSVPYEQSQAVIDAWPKGPAGEVFKILSLKPVL